MKILDKIIINEKEYICIKKLSIKSNIIYVCQEKNEKQVIYLKEDKITKKFEQTNNENIKKQIKKLTHAESPDCKM